MYKSYRCPISEHHPDHSKTLFMMEGDHLLLFCRRHKWLKLYLQKDGKNLDLKDVTIVAEQFKSKHIDNAQTPMIAKGKFVIK